MSTEYPLLTYQGDITKSSGVLPGILCGHDETLRPYVVLEAVYDKATDKTKLYLALATADQIRANLDQYQAMTMMTMMREPFNIRRA